MNGFLCSVWRENTREWLMIDRNSGKCDVSTIAFYLVTKSLLQEYYSFWFLKSFLSWVLVRVINLANIDKLLVHYPAITPSTLSPMIRFINFFSAAHQWKWNQCMYFFVSSIPNFQYWRVSQANAMQAWLVKPSRRSASKMAEMQEPYEPSNTSFNEEKCGV